MSPRPAFSRAWVALYLAAVALSVGVALFVRINTTPSLPPGLYLSLPGGTLRAGDDVFVCMPPGAAARLAVERGYVRASGRDCDSGGVPLLKHIRAAAGDTVRLSTDGAFVRGRRIGPSPPVHDSAGRPLQPVFGRHALGPGDLWLGSDAERGYDSRYLGPVPDSLAVGRAVCLLRF